MSVLETIGATPIVPLSSLVPPDCGQLLGKWEGANPGGSVKDRPALRLIREAERHGFLKPGGVIIEATSGNFGVALAMMGAALGYRVIIIVDPKVPPAHRRIIQAYGAVIAEVDQPDDSGGYFKPRLEMANRLARGIAGSFRPDQHFSVVNALAHYCETGPEIIAQMGPDTLGYLVVAVSTAGQLRGLGEFISRNSPATRLVAVDAEGSGVFGGERHAYLQSGIGLAWTPSNLDINLVDQVYRVPDADAFATCRHLARGQGLLAGSSSGAVAYVGMHLALEAPVHCRILCMLSDSGERYLDTLYDNGWVARHNLPVRMDLAELRERAARLQPLPREGVLQAIADAGCFVPADPPESTSLLNAVGLAQMSSGPHGEIGVTSRATRV